MSLTQNYLYTHFTGKKTEALARDTLETKSPWKTTFIHPCARAKCTYDYNTITLWLQLFCSWWQTERPSEYNGWPQQGLPGAHAWVCKARGTGAAWMKFKVGWKISWGSSQQNPCMKHTAALKTGYVEARAQKFYLAYELRVLGA